VDRGAPAEHADDQVTEDEKTLAWMMTLLVGATVGLLGGGDYLCANVATNLPHFYARLGWITAGAAFAQVFHHVTAARLNRWFAVDAISGRQNRAPQRIIGVVENLGYPCVLYGLGGDKGITLVSAWIGLKTIGDWRGWQEGYRHNVMDTHYGRRRLYLFMLRNAFQVAVAGLVYWLMPPR
jgi:hypothetical protein